MKNPIVFFLISLFVLSFQGLRAQSSDEKAIKSLITEFAEAGDQNDAQALDRILDENYRVVMNRLFGSSEVSIMPRSVYLEKIDNGEFGGDKRRVDISRILVNGSNAFVEATLKGKKMTMVSLFACVKDEKGKWKLLTDMPTVQ